MDSINLWEIPTLDEDFNSTDNVITIINKQAELLKSSTNGMVCARFDKLSFSISEALGELVLATKKTSTITKQTFESDEYSEEDTEKKDVSEFYRNNRFAFEIYNKNYKFRVFEIIISPMYPIEIIMDDDVSDYLSIFHNEIHNNKVSVSNDDELIKYLKSIFNAKKVKYIIQKMLKESIE